MREWSWKQSFSSLTWNHFHIFRQGFLLSIFSTPTEEEPRDGPSGFLMCLGWGRCCLLELALEKLNRCHIFHATVTSRCKMKEVLITLPTCLARFPPQLSKESANIRLDTQPVFLLFSNSCNVTLYKDFSLIGFFSPLCSPKNWKVIFAMNTSISQILRIGHILATYLTWDYTVISHRAKNRTQGSSPTSFYYWAIVSFLFGYTYSRTKENTFPGTKNISHVSSLVFHC